MNLHLSRSKILQLQVQELHGQNAFAPFPKPLNGGPISTPVTCVMERHVELIIMLARGGKNNFKKIFS
jgi:hypothetical protein